jgi:hypothetical protein
MASPLEMQPGDRDYFDVSDRVRSNPRRQSSLALFAEVPESHDPDRATYVTDDGPREEIRLDRGYHGWEWFYVSGDSVGIVATTRSQAINKAKKALKGFRMGTSKDNPYQGMFGTTDEHTVRMNPEADADSMYESFHGEPPHEQVEVVEEVHEHEYLATLGKLIELKVDTVTDLAATIGFEGDEPFLASNETGTQLYIVGGDQEIDLKAMKMDGDKWRKDLMTIGTITQVVYRTKKSFDDLEEIDYVHKLGEESGVRPDLLYDPISYKLHISGGKYFIKQPLVGVSPGIED